MNDMESVYDANSLLDAFNKSKKGTAWKESVQRYEMNLLRNINQTQKELKDGTYEQKDFYEFKLHERGKTRHIKSMHISDRVVQRSVCDNVLVPELSKYLTYDNGASMEGKGIHFARKRLSTHLHKFYRKHKSNEGYVLLIDFSKFFDNIVHDGLIKEMRKKIGDKETMSFIEKLINTFRVDVSYMTDEEYANCMKTLYNALEHAQIDKAKLTGEKYMRKSVGIGSQISQISGVYYPTRIDNYCKIVKGMKYYGRYMDDIYIIHEDKEYLKGLLNDIQGICDELGLFINPKKTQIVKLSHGFTFLKIKYNLTETGKVQERISKDSVTRMRRKLKKFRKLMDAGEMSFDDVRCAYASWKGGVSHCDSYNVVKSMDKLFDELLSIHLLKEDTEMSKTKMSKNEIEQKIRDLKTKLSCQESDIGDWKIAKCIEYSTLGMESPYDLQELHKQRQVIRDEIGALEEELAKCEDEDEAAAEK